jgi:hypothetical protein
MTGDVWGLMGREAFHSNPIHHKILLLSQQNFLRTAPRRGGRPEKYAGSAVARAARAAARCRERRRRVRVASSSRGLQPGS